jgi:hypothetical protein
MDGRCRAGEVVDFVDLDIEREGNVVTQEFKVRVFEQIYDVFFGASKKVIDTDDVIAFFEKSAAEM